MNPRGEEGTTVKGDLCHENLNLKFQTICKRGSSSWDSYLMRRIVLPNSVRLSDIKKS